jgi:hypothetical protein
MRGHTLFTLFLTAVMLGGFSLSAQAARIKCWKNKDGITECGETVPPEYSQKSHTELNDQGMVIEKTQRAKTKKELEEEAKAKAAAAEEKRKQKEKEKQDRILLYTYSSVDDIKMVRDEQLDAIEANIKVSRKRNEKIQGELDNRMKAAAAAEQAGKKPRASLLKDIDNLKKQIDGNNKFIEKKRNDIEKTKQEYEKKIARFKELKGES